MDAKKRKKLEAAGWKIGSAKEFLNLDNKEVEYIELKMSLSRSLAKLRRSKHLTQIQLAGKLKSSQSRVAKMEAGDPSVSIDLLIKSLFELDASKKDVARFISTTSKQEAY
jgi:predicted transcriptional regulator